MQTLIRLTMALCGLGLASTVAAVTVTAPWVGTWGVAPQSYAAQDYKGKTLRQIVHTSIAGRSVRIRLSNVFGDVPLTVSNVHVALRRSGSSIVAASDITLSFNGLPGVTVAPGESVTSDGVDFAVPALSDVAVSFYVPATTHAVTGHSFSNQSKYVASGDVAAQPDIAADENGDYQFLTNVDVQGDDLAGAVVTLGASITDGYASSYNANKRWPNGLATRLADSRIGVINEGISGNQLLNDGSGQSALNRFDRDVLSQAGVRWVIFSDDPLNDFGSNDQADSAAIIAAMKTLIQRAHARGIQFICSTLTPWQGATAWTASRETRRAEVNAFIRGGASGCDGIVDQDTATHDPSRPTWFLPAYDSGDHLHPNDAGYAAIAQSVNRTLFQSVSLPAITAPAGCGSIVPGEGLKPGQTVVSCDGRFTLNMQLDGNLVLYMGQDTVLMASGTVNQDAAQMDLSTDGRLVVRGTFGEALFSVGGGGTGDVRLFVQNDGNVVIYNGNGSPLWSTGTASH